MSDLDGLHDAPTTDGAPIVIADRVAIPCPACGDVIPVPIVVTIEGEPGEQSLLADPDMTDLWAHVWSHPAQQS